MQGIKIIPVKKKMSASALVTSFSFFCVYPLNKSFCKNIGNFLGWSILPIEINKVKFFSYCYGMVTGRFHQFPISKCQEGGRNNENLKLDIFDHKR